MSTEPKAVKAAKKTRLSLTKLITLILTVLPTVLEILDEGGHATASINISRDLIDSSRIGIDVERNGEVLVHKPKALKIS